MNLVVTPMDENQDLLLSTDLTLNLDGYEGPIDLLLTLARDQKVDLAKISILALAEQYLDYIEKARHLRLEIAADYLVMAAWLAYLKSRLLVPQEDNDDGGEELSGEALAQALAFQLKRLESMQKMAEKIFALPQLGRDVFTRKLPKNDETGVVYTPEWQVDLYDILGAYGAIARRQEVVHYKPKSWPLMSMDEAFERLERMLGKLPRKDGGSVWAMLDSFIPQHTDNVLTCRSSYASTLTATLEMAKQGQIDIRQDGLFKPVYIRETPQE